jgi:hypothetical protein
MKKLELGRLESPVVRENFRKLDAEFQGDNVFLAGTMKLFDQQYTASGTYSISHKLAYKPLDIIVLHDTAGFAYDHEDITETTITFTLADAGRIRFLLGRLK